MADHPELDVRAKLAHIDLMLSQTSLTRRQIAWERPRSIAMVILAAAAVFAAGGFSQHWFPTPPQTITIHVEGPIPIRLLP